MGERVGRDHLHLQANLLSDIFELGEVLLTLGVVSAEGRHVVVVECHCGGACLLELGQVVPRFQGGAGGLTELVTGSPPHGPQAVGKFVVSWG